MPKGILSANVSIVDLCVNIAAYIARVAGTEAIFKLA
jgi:hypothetical protein